MEFNLGQEPSEPLSSPLPNGGPGEMAKRPQGNGW